MYTAQIRTTVNKCKSKPAELGGLKFKLRSELKQTNPECKRTEIMFTEMNKTTGCQEGI